MPWLMCSFFDRPAFFTGFEFVDRRFREIPEHRKTFWDNTGRLPGYHPVSRSHDAIAIIK